MMAALLPGEQPGKLFKAIFLHLFGEDAWHCNNPRTCSWMGNK